MTHKPFTLLAIHELLSDQELKDTGVVARDLLELKALVVRLFRDPDYRAPAFPELAMELYLRTKHGDARPDQVAALIDRDPELAREVWDGARGDGEPRSVTDAVARLGVRRTAQVALRSGFERSIFRSRHYGAAMDRLRIHSVFTAELLGVVSDRSGMPTEDAYLAGLLHDVGIAGILLALENAGISVPIARAWPTVWAVHESCSQHLAALWGFSEALSTSIGLHHSLVLDGDDDAATLALSLVDTLAHEVDCGIHDHFSRRNLGPVAAALGIDGPGLADLRARSRALSSALKQPACS